MNFNDLRLAYQDFFNCWNWELFLTIRFNKSISLDSAIKESKLYLNQIKKTFPIKFAGLINVVFNSAQDVHAHILLISQTRKIKPACLLDLPKADLINLCRHDCHISTRDEWSGVETVSAYLSKEKNLSLFKPDRNEIAFFRKGLLEGMLERK